jgi:hypothetical protein
LIKLLLVHQKNPFENDLGIGIEWKKLEDLYAWIDKIPLSRPKKKIERDFSDGKSQSNRILFSKNKSFRYLSNWSYSIVA